MQGALQELHSQYGDRIRFVWKNDPLPFHPFAMGAAEAGMEAAAQGKFWPMHDLMFQRQGNLDPDGLRNMAKEVGLDMNRFEQAVFKDHSHLAEIQADVAEGQRLGVQGTPTFFINGQKLVGAQPYEQFRSAVEQALAGK